MVADGYGVCYSQLEGRMNVGITAWRSCDHTSAAQFRDALSGALVDMGRACADALAEAAEGSSKL